MLDGVPNPAEGQAKSDDAAYLTGVRYDRKPFYLAVTHAWLKNHELDDLGRFFSGRGLEVHADYRLSGALRLRSTYNLLEPDDDHGGSYRLNYGVLGFNYQRGTWLSVHLLYRIDASRASEGNSLRGDVLALTTHFNF